MIDTLAALTGAARRLRQAEEAFERTPDEAHLQLLGRAEASFKRHQAAYSAAWDRRNGYR